MAAVLITKEVRAVDEAGHRGVDSNDDFVTIQENYQDSQRLKFQPDLEEFRIQANALSEDVNSKSTIASDSAVIATNKASESSGYSVQAKDYRDEAETFKDQAVAAVATLPEGTLNDAIISSTTAWSSQETNDRINALDVDTTLATLTKTFIEDEKYTLNLSSIQTIPNVSILKEVPDTNINNNDWDVNTIGYEQESDKLEISNQDIRLKNNALGYDIAEASYDSISFSVNSQDTSPKDLAFNDDGTKMYYLGSDGDSIYQYTLSTAYDISTASYDSISFSVSSQDATPASFIFNDSGTKMYVLGDNSNSVYQYTLSTAYDLSTAGYDSISFNANSQDTGMLSLAFSNDGTKMYLGGYLNDTIYQYTLSTAYDLSTTTYDSVSFDVSTEIDNPLSMSFNSNGTKMYILAQISKNVYQYTLSTAYDLSTTTYDSVSFDVSLQDATPISFIFGKDGTKLYYLGDSTNSIYQYTSQGKNYDTLDYEIAITSSSSQMNTHFWLNINSMTPSEVLNNQTIYYALSSDDKTTFQVLKTVDGARNIIRNNGGTWEYNSNATYANETWTSAVINTIYQAFKDAMTIATNQMNSAQIIALTYEEQLVLDDVLSLGVILHTTNAEETPQYQGFTINYNSLSKWERTTESESTWNTMNGENVEVTSLVANNLKIRVL